MENNEPNIDIDFEALESGEGQPDEEKFAATSNKKELQTILSLDDENEWREWIRSGFVRPWWEELQRDFLSKREKQERGQGLRDIQVRLITGESRGNTKYSVMFPNKTDWDGADHLARFHYHVRRENERSNEGVFYGQNFSEELIDKLVWSLKGYLMKIHTQSYIDKPTGGRAIFGTTLAGTAIKRKGSPFEETMSKTSKTVNINDNNNDEESNGDHGGIDDHELEIPAITSESWKRDLVTPREHIILSRQSDTFDPKERYWQFRLICEALQRTNIVSADQEMTEPHSTEEPTQHMDWEPPTDLPGATEATIMPGLFDPNRYSDIAEIENFAAADIDTADHAAQLIEPTSESLRLVEQQKRILDNRDYQRENHSEACQVLGINENRALRMSSMNRTATFKHWQPVAIAAMHEILRRDYLHGVVLGDTVGLGKTWEAVGFLLHAVQKFEESVIAAEEEGRPTPKASPFLIIVPPGLIMQWTSEISAITKHLRVFVYYSDVRGTTDISAPQITRRLKANDGLFNGGVINARTVVLTSYQTLNQRHGPPAARTWASANNITIHDNLTVPPTDFPFALQGCFRTLVLDEAHSIRNPLSSQARAVSWLDAENHVLLTATLIYNSKEDLRGYMPFLFPTPSLWSNTDWDDFGVSTDTNVFNLPQDHPGARLCCTVEAVERYILNPDVPNNVAGDRLRNLLGHFLLRRTLSSHMPFNAPRAIGADIPPMQREIISCKFSDDENQMFKTLSSTYSKGLFTPSPADPNRYIWNMRKLRKLVLFSTWLGFHYVERSLEAANIPTACAKLNTGKIAPALARAIHSGASIETGSLRHFFENASVNNSESRTWTLEFMLRGSPKMRAMLPILRDQVIVYGEKAIIWTQFPAEQVYVAATLHEAKIDAQVFHAGLSAHDRSVLVDRFTREFNSCKVLVCSYSVNSAGLNLQNLCRNVHLFSPGMSKSITDQAIGRVCRIGQSRMVLVYEYHLQNRFTTMLLMRNKLKSIPGLVAEMNPDEIHLGGEHDIGRWVVRNGSAHRLADEEQPGPQDDTDANNVLGALLVWCQG